MKKIFLILSLIAMVLFSVPIASFAQEENSTEEWGSLNTTENALSCFDYYKFQSVQVNMGPVSVDNKAGDIMEFSGSITNDNLSPVFDGNVFVRISEENPSYFEDGHDIIDEFVAIKGINLDVGQKKDFSFTWTAPTGLKSGSYVAHYFFFVGNGFNLSGLTFTNEIYIGFVTFNILSKNTGKIYFDRSTTKVNNEKYIHIGAWPQLKTGSNVNISQVIKNIYTTPKKVDITYELYHWDSLNSKNLLNSKTESIDIGANSVQTLSYDITNVDQSVYYLQITAKSGTDTSIINIRITSDTSKARLNYVGLNKFPVQKGDDFSLYTCYHNTNGNNTTGSVITKVYDSKNNILGETKYTGDITGAISVKIAELTASKTIKEAKIISEIYNDTNNLVDTYEVKYSCDNFDTEACQPMEMPWYLPVIVVVLVVTLLILIVILFMRKKISKNSTQIFIALLLILLFGTIYFAKDILVDAQQIVSADGRIVTETKSISFDIGWNDRRVAYGNAGLVFSGRMNGNFDLDIGQSVTFTANYTCSFNFTAGAWDTPWCGSVQVFDEAGSGSRDGKLIFWNSDVNFSVVSSNPAAISCSGMVCTAVGSGLANLTLRSNDVVMTPVACVWREGNIQTCTKTDISLVTFNNTQTLDRYIYYKDPATGYYDTGAISHKTIPKFSHTFNLRVKPTGLVGTCGNVSWNAVPGATRYALRIDNLANGWKGSCSVEQFPGDYCLDNVSTNSFSFDGIEGSNYSWSVHPVFGTIWGGSSGSTFSCSATPPIATTTPPTSTTTPSCTSNCDDVTIPDGPITNPTNILCGPAYNQTFGIAPSSNLCTNGSINTWVTDGGNTWDWYCNDTVNNRHSICSATKTPSVDINLSCPFIAEPSNPIQVNTKTTWTINPNPSNVNISWYVKNSPTTEYTLIQGEGKNGTTLEHFFTTVGAKEIKAVISTSTSSFDCFASTTPYSVVQTGGNIQEQ